VLQCVPCKTAEQVIAALRAHEAELRQAGLRSLSLFGSVARGETEADSDIDLARSLTRLPGWTSSS
jgi:predicted nucleotidyltransferase